MNAYQMCINNVAAKIRKSEPGTFNAFDAAKYLSAAFCKSETDILADILKVNMSRT